MSDDMQQRLLDLEAENRKLKQLVVALQREKEIAGQTIIGLTKERDLFLRMVEEIRTIVK